MVQSCVSFASAGSIPALTVSVCIMMMAHSRSASGGVSARSLIFQLSQELLDLPFTVEYGQHLARGGVGDLDLLGLFQVVRPRPDVETAVRFVLYSHTPAQQSGAAEKGQNQYDKFFHII